ncbi:TadE/TadG family type IV pilus assembly protein [Methylobacterium symbioticum]|uniref:Putative Flp pilus-assembly TadG-like N-terminal domain-containing protein n=1 Tax=Methylobacterium symbioticum TaxID=2584084 RepID=A0A509E6H5_9HYPH|nr:pilus assembly protein TadG-related protein [Methylobacterium symbioticum]VUD69886.1 hypothetical protein MET9862_00446 [Methylobacterium symbioticum]
MSEFLTRHPARPGPASRYMDPVLRRFVRARGGHVAVTFVVFLIPILFAAGAAIDYGRRGAAKAELDALLDAAVLGVIAQKTNTITAAMVDSARAQFLADAAKVPGVTKITSFTATPVQGATQLGLTAAYTAIVQTTLSGLMMKTVGMTIGGQSSSVRRIAQYIDFYLLLDNSPSMGLAATSADIQRMQTVANGCAFACHLPNPNGSENLNDNYHIAKRNNIKLRIDVLRSAVSNLVDSAKASMSLPQQFRMEMWTFSDVQTRLSQLTADLEQVKRASAQIDMATSYQDQRDCQTSYGPTLSKMTDTIPVSGDGVTPASPIRFLFFVTDGVQDLPFARSKPRPTIGSVINDGRYIGPIDPALCQSMKDKKIRIGIIYTQYLPLYNNGFYNSYVKPFENNIGPLLKSCATDGLYFAVSTNGDINQAMQQLFSAAMSSVRITN